MALIEKIKTGVLIGAVIALFLLLVFNSELKACFA